MQKGGGGHTEAHKRAWRQKQGVIIRNSTIFWYCKGLFCTSVCTKNKTKNNKGMRTYAFNKTKKFNKWTKRCQIPYISHADQWLALIQVFNPISNYGYFRVDKINPLSHQWLIGSACISLAHCQSKSKKYDRKHQDSSTHHHGMATIIGIGQRANHNGR
jgi:hypothetical protein